MGRGEDGAVGGAKLKGCDERDSGLGWGGEGRRGARGWLLPCYEEAFEQQSEVAGREGGDLKEKVSSEKLASAFTVNF